MALSRLSQYDGKRRKVTVRCVVVSFGALVVVWCSYGLVVTVELLVFVLFTFRYEVQDASMICLGVLCSYLDVCQHTTTASSNLTVYKLKPVRVPIL